MVADRIRFLREQMQMTQTDLSKRLGITRSSVNAWELGISIPSTQYIVELAEIFGISTDFLLGVEDTATISVAGLTQRDIQMLCSIIAYMKEQHSCD
ncbi:MAG: helix-turn-helix transcriptional regulator [Oscillospiraceae bacterium]|nr:helix-turn-helix transcriptional regulator [Oscillospiraceae bacterium]